MDINKISIPHDLQYWIDAHKNTWFKLVRHKPCCIRISCMGADSLFNSVDSNNDRGYSYADDEIIIDNTENTVNSTGSWYIYNINNNLYLHTECSEFRKGIGFDYISKAWDFKGIYASNKPFKVIFK